MFEVESEFGIELGAIFFFLQSILTKSAPASLDALGIYLSQSPTYSFSAGRRQTKLCYYY